MATVHENDLEQAELNLRIDLGRKINEILRAHGSDVSATPEILRLLELESQESYLTRKDAAQLRIRLSELVDAAQRYGQDPEEHALELITVSGHTHQTIRKFTRG